MAKQQGEKCARTHLVSCRYKFWDKWWPGTESNRRRQPFQDCGHFFEGLRRSRMLHALRALGIAHPERSRFFPTWKIYGGQGRNRTADASLFRAALYRLSYLAISGGLHTCIFGGIAEDFVRTERF
jgi:hypothetical protein